MSANRDVTRVHDKIMRFVRENVSQIDYLAVDPETGHFLDVEPAVHMNDLLDEYGHALASMIREQEITPSGHPSYDDGKDAGLDIAADLIDPYTSEG